MRFRMLSGAGVIAFGGLSLLALPVAQAHDCCRGPHGCPMAGQSEGRSGGERPPGGPIYDPDTVTTLRGTATAVAVVPARDGRMGGVHITLASDGQAMDVHLGPAWFLAQKELALDKGDAVEVTGSVIESSGETFLIARELKAGQKVVRFRDEQGIPAWAGARRP